MSQVTLTSPFSTIGKGWWSYHFVVVIIIIVIIIIIYIILWRNSSQLTYDYILELFGGQTCKSRPRYVFL